MRSGEWEFTREWGRKAACGPGTIWTRLVSGKAGARRKPYATFHWLGALEMADQGHVPQEAPGPSTEPSTGKGAPQFGLTAAMALIVGSIIGVGVFNLPTSLAGYGPITLVSMALTTVGALALALLFASLSRRLPADGGPYAHSRVAFGNGLGFANAWSHWITAWAGNAAIAVGWVLYVEVFINKGQTKIWSILLVLAGVW